MEANQTKLSETFTVDDLLSKLTEQNTQEMDEAQKRTLLVDVAEIAEQQAAGRGDIGNMLVREVRTFLNSNEAAAMLAFEDLVQQLGDMCLDHMHNDVSDSISRATTISLDNDRHEPHDHASHQNMALRKTRAKNKKKPLTLFEYFIKRQRHQANKKRTVTFLCP